MMLCIFLKGISLGNSLQKKTPSKSEAKYVYVQITESSIFASSGLLVWKRVWLQYPKYTPIFIQTHGTLCLKFRRICQYVQITESSIFASSGLLVWKRVWLQYPKYTPIFIQTHGTLCLKFRRICQPQCKFIAWKPFCLQKVSVTVMVFNATLNNISGILWQSVLLEEETGVHGENHQPVTSHWQTWSHVYRRTTVTT